MVNSVETRFHKNELLCRRWVEEVWNGGREEMIDVLFADSGAASYPYFVKSEERLAGREEFKRFYRRVREQFEEIHVEIDEISPKSDQVVAACVVRAKSRPGVLGPESQTVETRSLCLYRIVGDRIAEIWNNVELDEPELSPFRLDFASN